jgi:hypothetical protein
MSSQHSTRPLQPPKSDRAASPSPDAAAAAAAARQWTGYTKWQKQRGSRSSQLNDNRSVHLKQVLLLLCSVAMIITGSFPTLLVPDFCPPTPLLDHWHDCSLTALLLSATPAHTLLLVSNTACAGACCWLLLLVYRREDWINRWLDAVHTHSYNSLSSTLHAAYGSASAQWLLSSLTSINYRANHAFSSVLKVYAFNIAFSIIWLFAGGGGGWRAIFIIVQSAGYPLYTLYSGFAITRMCLPPSAPPLKLPFNVLPHPEGPLAVSLLLTEFVSFNVLDPQKSIVMREMAAAAADNIDAAATDTRGGPTASTISKKRV